MVCGCCWVVGYVEKEFECLFGCLYGVVLNCCLFFYDRVCVCWVEYVIWFSEWCLFRLGVVLGSLVWCVCFSFV